MNKKLQIEHETSGLSTSEQWNEIEDTIQTNPTGPTYKELAKFDLNKTGRLEKLKRQLQDNKRKQRYSDLKCLICSYNDVIYT